MIQLQQVPLPDDKVILLRAWLNAPGAREFQRYLSALSANKAAMAGNCLEKGEEQDIVEAKDNADTARRFTAFVKLIEEMRDPDYKFHPNDMKPEIITQK